MSENPYMDLPDRNPYMELPDQDEGMISKSVGAVDSAIDAVDEFTQPAQDALVKSGNAVLDTIQVLDRPRNAIAGAVKNTYQGKSFSEGFNKGLSGEEYTSTQQLIPEKYRFENPVKSTMGGIVGDILTDPLTYTPATVITTPVRMLKAGARSLGVTNVATKIADNGVFKAFNFYVGEPKKAKELANTYRRLVGGIRTKIPKDAKHFNQEINDLAKELNVSPEGLKEAITNTVESGYYIGKDKADDIVDRLVTRNREMLELERAYGVDIGDLGPTYMAHILTPDGKAAVTKANTKKYLADFLSKNPQRTHPSAEMRELEGTVAEINSRELYGTEKLFTDDPVVIMAVREMRHAQALGGAKFIDAAKKEFGVKASEAPEHYVTAAGIKGYKFDPEVAKAIDVGYGKISGPKEMNELIQLYDGAQQWWKMWSLGARPAYHMRNVMGNVWNAYLGGLKDPLRFGSAAKLQWMGRNKTIEGKIAGLDAKEVYDNAVELGVMGRGQYHADMGISIQQELGKASKNPLTLKTDNPVLQAGFKGGQALESNARLALFIDRLKKGDSYDDAAKHVNKYLFDYDDLGKFEEQWMKRFFPFYTWTRKNIPLQLEAIAMHPDKVQKINIIRNNIEQDVDKPDPKNVQDYVKESGPTYFGEVENNDVKKVFTLMNYHPLMDVGRLLTPTEMITGLTSPIIKAPLEYFANYDSFRKRDIKEWRGQSTDWMGIRMPVRLAHLAKNLVMLNEIDRANPYNVFGKNQEVNGEKEQTSSFGMDKELSYRFPEEVPLVGGEIFGVGTPRESRLDLPGKERLLQYLFGVRAYSVDEGLGETMRYVDFEKDVSKLDGLIRREYYRGNKSSAEEALRARGLDVEEFFKEDTETKKRSMSR